MCSSGIQCCTECCMPDKVLQGQNIVIFKVHISVLKLIYVLTSPEHCCDLYGNVYWR